MAYTLATVRNRILTDKLDDPDYEADIVDRFINDAQRAIFNAYELPFQEKVFNGTLPSGVSVVLFPDDYQQMQSLVLQAADGSVVDISENYVEFREFNKRFPVPDNREPAKPSLWTIYGGKLYLSQRTDQEYTLTMFYLKTPTFLSTDSSVPEIPEAFEELLVLGGYFRVLERNEDYDQAAYVKNGDYQDQLALMLQRYSKRQTGKPSIIGTPSRVPLRRGRRS